MLDFYEYISMHFAYISWYNILILSKPHEDREKIILFVWTNKLYVIQRKSCWSRTRTIEDDPEFCRWAVIFVVSMMGKEVVDRKRSDWFMNSGHIKTFGITQFADWFFEWNGNNVSNVIFPTMSCDKMVLAKLFHRMRSIRELLFKLTSGQLILDLCLNQIIRGVDLTHCDAEVTWNYLRLKFAKIFLHMRRSMLLR